MDHCLEVQVDLARANACLLGLAATSTSSVHLTFDLCVGANVSQGCSVSVVAVDTSQLVSFDGGNTLDVDSALALRRALLN